MTSNVVNWWDLQFEIKRLDDIWFFVKNFCLFEFLASNLFIDDTQLQRMDLFIFGSWEHWTHSNQVQILYFELHSTILHVGIHEEHASEECLLGHFVWGKDFDHPVNHLRPKWRGDAVLSEHVCLSLGCWADVSQDIEGVIFANQLRIGLFELKGQSIKWGDRGLGGSLAHLVLSFHFDEGDGVNVLWLLQFVGGDIS